MPLGCGCKKPKPVVICPKECDPDSLTPMGLYNGYEGEWKKGKVYSINQAVYHDKKFYVSLKNCNDAEPTGSTDDNWYLYSKDGIKALGEKDKEQDARLDAIEAKEAEQDAAIDNSSSGKRTISDGKVYMILNNGDKVEQRDVLYRLDDSVLI